MNCTSQPWYRAQPSNPLSTHALQTPQMSHQRQSSHKPTPTPAFPYDEPGLESRLTYQQAQRGAPTPLDEYEDSPFERINYTLLFSLQGRGNGRPSAPATTRGPTKPIFQSRSSALCIIPPPPPSSLPPARSPCRRLTWTTAKAGGRLLSSLVLLSSEWDFVLYVRFALASLRNVLTGRTDQAHARPCQERFRHATVLVAI